jgi:hypothetical protein
VSEAHSTNFVTTFTIQLATLAPRPLAKLNFVRAMTDSSTASSDDLVDDDAVLHAFKNHLSVIVGFCDLLLREVPHDDPRHGDILEIRNAGQAAMTLIPQLAARVHHAR